MISMTRWIKRFRRFVILITAVAFFPAAGGGAPVPKPQLPIKLEFGTTGPVSVGTAVMITLTVTPLIPSESVTVSVALPDGVSLVEGSTTWTGALAKGQSQVLMITVRPEQAASFEINGMARLTMANGSEMNRRAVLMLDLNPSRLKPSLQQRSGPGGNTILEIPAESRPKTK